MVRPRLKLVPRKTLESEGSRCYSDYITTEWQFIQKKNMVAITSSQYVYCVQWVLYLPT